MLVFLFGIWGVGFGVWIFSTYNQIGTTSSSRGTTSPLPKIKSGSSEYHTPLGRSVQYVED